MKNKSKIFNLIGIFLFNIFILTEPIFAKEVKFKAKEIITYEEGNLIVGQENTEVKIENELEIFADKFTYNKKKEFVVAEGSVLVKDLLNDIQIKSDKITYDKIKNEFVSLDKTFFNIKKKYKIFSEDVVFNLNDNVIFSKKKTDVKDNLLNDIKLSSFKYFHDTEILKGKNIELLDNKQNKYFLNSGMFKLNEYMLLGKDIKILLRNDTFGVVENEPKLKGNSVSYKNDKTIITKGIFTSCKENNNCPPWSIVSKNITHDKKKREIHYKNAWLKIYNTPVLYFPKFFHPDPTVDRKSGFLMPSFGDSKNLGASVNIPYFYVISESEDLTFKPRFFSNTEYLLQSEYRKEMKNSSHVFDFSVNKTENDGAEGRKTHFFSNSQFNLNSNFFDSNIIDLKIEKVSNDDYTQLYSLESTSPIIKDTSVLENIIEYSGSNDFLDLKVSLESYESMNKLTSDRYEFIYPNYSLSTSKFLDDDFFSGYDFTSSGYQKKHSTNIYEGVLINDLVLSSNDFINKFGFNHSLKTLFKNVNSDGNNSSKFKNQSQSEILSQVSYDFNLPLIKQNLRSENLLIPKFSLRYSPNDTKNIKDETRHLNSDNIFSLNRIGFNETIESGTSLTLGLDFDKKNKESGNTFFSSKIATVFRDEINENLPKTSTLGKKSSDFVGNMDIVFNKNFNLDYEYSLDNDLDQFNFHKIENILTVNNFVNKFTFYEENNLIGNKSYFENDLSYKFDDTNSLTFKTRENKKDNLTEYYNLIYEYKKDCLVASIRYNKEYYSSGSIKPNEELFFNITLIPLGSTQTDSILD